MKYSIFTVYDKKLVSYMQPFFSVNAATAMRAFGDACTGDNSMLSQHPEDFCLYKIADYEDATGEIKSYPPVAIAEASDTTEPIVPNDLAHQLNKADDTISNPDEKARLAALSVAMRETNIEAKKNNALHTAQGGKPGRIPT